MKEKALVVFSGGMDSATALAWAIREYGEVETLTFSYGSKHNAEENAHAREICRKLHVENTLIDLGFIGKYFRSDLLLSGGDIPEGRYDAENMKSTVVPFRNGIMLAVAAGFAESRNCNCVVIGNHSGDHAIYPDCRKPFIDGMTAAVREGTGARIEIVSPFCSMTKTAIAKLGTELGVDFSLTYSCYKGGKKHCGKCGTCTERIEAFREAGIPDPTEYEK